MGQGCSCADSNDKEQEVRTDPVSYPMPNMSLYYESRDSSKPDRSRGLMQVHRLKLLLRVTAGALAARVNSSTMATREATV